MVAPEGVESAADRIAAEYEPTAAEVSALDAEAEELARELREVEELTKELRLRQGDGGALAGGGAGELDAACNEAASNLSGLAEERWRLETYAELERMKQELIGLADGAEGLQEGLRAATDAALDVEVESVPARSPTGPATGAASLGDRSGMGADLLAAAPSAATPATAEEHARTHELMAEMEAEFEALQAQLERARRDRDELGNLKACLEASVAEISAEADAPRENTKPPDANTDDAEE